MTGGLLQLVATGVQDIFIIGNPQITFFKVVYQRHTNFSMESINAPGDGDLNFGNKLVYKISRNGDLIHTVILEVDVPLLQSTNAGQPGGGQISWVNALGHALINKVELEIGGQVIDRQYGEWMEIWSQLSIGTSKKYAYDTLISRSENYQTVTGPLTVYIPLQFWFCRNIGLALPLIALQYHEVKINVYFRTLDELYTFGPVNYYTGSKAGSTVTITSNNPEFTYSDTNKIIVWSDGTTDTIQTYSNTTTVLTSAASSKSSQSFYIKPNDSLLASQNYKILDARMFIDYIYLDTYERKKFAQMKHSYLIEQIQYSEPESYTVGQTSKKFTLNFNLPVKALYWVAQLDDVDNTNDWFNFSNTVNPNITKGDAITTAQLFLNGTERFEARTAPYFRLVQPLQYHTTTPKNFVYMYSFSLKPEDHQPSGHCNFSKIDIVDLNINFNALEGNSSFRCYAINYNVLRIFSGMAGQAFSN
jgi:hypothetical protein